MVAMKPKLYLFIVLILTNVLCSNAWAVTACDVSLSESQKSQDYSKAIRELAQGYILLTNMKIEDVPRASEVSLSRELLKKKETLILKLGLNTFTALFDKALQDMGLAENQRHDQRDDQRSRSLRKENSILGVWKSRATLSHNNGYKITSATFSPDGRFILTISMITARVWDVITGKMKYELPGQREILQAMFSPEGRFIVTSSMDSAARVWDAANGTLMHTLKDSDDWILSSKFSPDSSLIVTVSATDKVARIWDVATGKLKHKLQGHTKFVSSATFSSDGNSIVTTSRDGSARIWDAATGSMKQELSGHTQPVVSAAFSSDNRFIVTTSHDKTARVWDATSGDLVHELRGHEERVDMAMFSSNGNLIVTAANHSTVRVWDAITGIMKFELSGDHIKDFNSVIFSPDDRFILMALEGGVASIWNVESGALLHELKGFNDSLSSASFNPNGNLILTTAFVARIWELVASDD